MFYIHIHTKYGAKYGAFLSLKHVLFQVFTPDGSIVDGEIVDHKNGTYEFVYMVPKEGDFSLALRLYDQHIKGSPFKLTVTKALDAELEVIGQNILRLKSQSV